MEAVLERQLKKMFTKGKSDVCLHNWMLGRDEARLISKFISDDCSARHLDLSYNIIGPKGAMHIAASLRENQSLVSLDLSINRIGGGVYELAEAVLLNRSLRNFNMARNRLSEAELLFLVETLAERVVPLRVDISDNEVTSRVRLSAARLRGSSLDVQVGRTAGRQR